jgi:ADP-ribose pyrophosphatase
MHEPWIVLDEEVAYENRWVRVRLQRLQLPRGEAYDYTVVDRPAQGVAVALRDDSGDILMEREYRHGIGQVVWQIPGGLVDESESALTSAQRELREETGYEAREWVELGEFYDNPALGNASTRLFVARGPARVQEPCLDIAEMVELRWVSLEWLRAAVKRGEIVDRVVLSALGILWAHGELDSGRATGMHGRRA